MRYLLDTNICIYLIKGKPAKVLANLGKYAPAAIGVSTITVAELEYGVRKSLKPEQNQEALDAFLAPFETVPFGDSAAQHYGEIRTILEKQGAPIVAMDLLVAAHARSLGLPVVTNNTKEFERVPGLLVENWAR